jgi:hypothetical protein
MKLSITRYFYLIFLKLWNLNFFVVQKTGSSENCFQHSSLTCHASPQAGTHRPGEVLCPAPSYPLCSGDVEVLWPLSPDSPPPQRGPTPPLTSLPTTQRGSGAPSPASPPPQRGPAPPHLPPAYRWDLEPPPLSAPRHGEVLQPLSNSLSLSRQPVCVGMNPYCMTPILIFCNWYASHCSLLE